MNEIVKKNVKYRYPWNSLEIGDIFIIGQDNLGGRKYHRQLVYAANKSYAKKELPNRFKSSVNQDNDVVVQRVL
jgi:hypothetical protein